MIMTAMLLALVTPQDPAAAPDKPERDPNRITCVNRLKTGSRTNFVQICHTQAEWNYIKRENRGVVERGQQQQNRMDRDPPNTRGS